jgi:HTH-type transcriptional regulator, glycine betaine synthesis regulator
VIEIPATSDSIGANPPLVRPCKLVRRGGRADEVVAFEEAMVDYFVQAADMLGVPKSVAAIYAICFANIEPLGFAEINERLEISVGSISQGLKVLREIGALKVVNSPQKRDRFVPDLELRKLVIHFIVDRVEKQLVVGKFRLAAIHSHLPASANEELKARIQALHSWNDKGRALLPLMMAFLKLT